MGQRGEQIPFQLMNTTENTTTGAGNSAARIICHVFSPVDGANRQTVWTIYEDGSALTQEITRHLSYAGSERCTYSEFHGAGSEEALLIHRMADAESLAEGYYRQASERQLSAIRALDFALFGGQCGRGEFENLDSARTVACELRDAFRDLFRNPSLSNAAKVYALRGTRERSGNEDFAFARLAAVYGIGSAPYLQPESGMD